MNIGKCYLTIHETYNPHHINQDQAKLARKRIYFQDDKKEKRQRLGDRNCELAILTKAKKKESQSTPLGNQNMISPLNQNRMPGMNFPINTTPFNLNDRGGPNMPMMNQQGKVDILVELNILVFTAPGRFPPYKSQLKALFSLGFGRMPNNHMKPGGMFPNGMLNNTTLNRMGSDEKSKNANMTMLENLQNLI